MDLTLILRDISNEITINVKRATLCKYCYYFEALLTKFQGVSTDKITICVPNAHIARDIIISYCDHETNTENLSDWKYVLEFARCYDYFGLDFDKSLLKNLEVPEKGFELLLEIIDLIDSEGELYYLIEMNIPTNYELSDDFKKIIKEKIDRYQKQNRRRCYEEWLRNSNPDP